ncbi:NHLP leader peptide family RiPP precursor [Pseudomonas putida]|uniref:NHLP leader peptide family RiPP precursor n=1 Tax=Pseudomonas putida TaxID=303 RepID=UPI001CD6E581|nr:NHLP leader peptide family RiPP precursor [Pseudomonas putida]
MKTFRIFFPYGQLPHEIIVKAWQDEDFKKELLKNPNKAFEKAGFSSPAADVKVVINNQKEATFVLPEMPNTLMGASFEDMLAHSIASTGDKASGTCDTK